jgi:predicted histidine transporter YuiF (NhaC family)
MGSAANVLSVRLPLPSAAMLILGLLFTLGAQMAAAFEFPVVAKYFYSGCLTMHINSFETLTLLGPFNPSPSR